MTNKKEKQFEFPTLLKLSAYQIKTNEAQVGSSDVGVVVWYISSE